MVLVCVLIAVWAVQATFNACEEGRIMASIDTMLTDEYVVVRNGSHVGISARNLIPGDVVVVRQGDRLAGDVRFVEVSSDAMFDRARLYGMYISSVVSLAANNVQANRSFSPPLSEQPRRAILIQTILGCEVQTASAVAV
jgi:hypothetical protein